MADYHRRTDSSMTTSSESSSSSTPRHMRQNTKSRRRATSFMTSLTAMPYAYRSPVSISKSTASVVLAVRPGKHDALGSFTPTGSATNSLRYLVGPTPRRRQLQPLWLDTYSDSPSSSGPPSPIIPSISRTASPPYVINPSSPPYVMSSSPNRHQRSSSEGMQILESLERKSKLCVNKVQCATCKKVGADFPRCGKCSLMWCSRECRLVGGKRHVCRPQTMCT
ncbi:hypothetical protein BDN72DRAFT_632627 [Pluteus cervinus]|uniref:Uncharacterized protein n=1 Tax=Pluteus cervinus TaxID=181527 RepID=A0ACD3BB13_9AGAR|nr:hypothetical protein BDN72DRAFT_632627 [Pluteus cervinus]